MTNSQIPGWWAGSKPEWIVFNALQSLRKSPLRDFMFKTSPYDSISFQFINPDDLAINVVGLMQNYENGEDRTSSDMLSRQQLIGKGVHLIFIDDVDLVQDPSYYVEEALNYRDHSHMGA